MSDEVAISLLTEIRNCIRAASYTPIKLLLESALPDPQSRVAYQMFDGSSSIEQVRTTAKISPNKLLAISQKWTSMGLMEIAPDKKRKRLFDLRDFGLIETEL